MTEPRPVAPPDNVTQHWWEAAAEGRLLFERCNQCGHAQLYPRGICTACKSSNPVWAESEGRGTVYSFTVVHRAPHPAFTPPYTVALVRLDEGPVVMCNIEGDVRCDMRVRAIWEPLPDGRKLLQFEPED